MPESLLEREIFEQPEVIRKLINVEAVKIEQTANQLKETFGYVVIAARGTSDNAARYAKYMLGAHNQLQVALAAPSLFTLYKRPPDFSHALVIGISQSGQSPDVVAVLEEAKRQARPTLAITNNENSPLAKTAKYTIALQTDPEQAIAATKTYTASLVSVALFSIYLKGDLEYLTPVHRLPELIDQTLKDLDEPMRHIERYRYMEHCAVLGRGYNYATAFEIALKIKELNHIVAEPYSSADFRHGPIGMVREGFPVILVAPAGVVYQDMSDLCERLQAQNCELLVISDQDKILEQAQLAMKLPAEVPEWLTPVLAVLPGQLIGLHLARAKGLDPDQPKGLHKVTETW
jgi:glucosamine--fructose-6-phosphate aminotransferase (isomerizing)